LRTPSRRSKRSSLFAPVAAPNEPIASGDPPFDCGDQGQGKICGVIGHDIRGICYRDAAHPGSGNID
jgi:hypothetical protein